ncbi:MAG: iron-containing alcohol dehydrogenase [Vallitalea sp.]|nr:iron-containing alcohol dehydrogenase [Vallitalea sp.]
MMKFEFAKVPQTIFGSGEFSKIYELIEVYGANNILLVSGARSFRKSRQYIELINIIKKRGINLYETKVVREPSPDLIDDEVDKYRDNNIDLIIAVGGGSVIDTGKAISAMLTQKDSVMAFLEGVGEGKTHNGKKITFIAVPTTSGTGSEATKNAVLSKVSKDGFKKSLRHNNFIPDNVIIDAELLITCPTSITIASGLDALTQLIGSYLSTHSSAMTDSLALSGLEYFSKSFMSVCTEGYNSIEKRGQMAYGAYISGITLANAGLGIVHGFASSVGGYFDIPHGVICGTLLPEAIKVNVELLRQKNDMIYLEKYAKVSSILTGCNGKDTIMSCYKLIEILEKWVEELKVPKLGEFNVREEDIDRIIKITSNKYNPVQLSSEDMRRILVGRM